ncbi:MAG TPA: DUF4126 domain-containing protein [Gemmatimonadaceae bacterium]|nr:DUF4126 domain-containing protein [Gemmatimonadaceae bacterium]
MGVILIYVAAGVVLAASAGLRAFMPLFGVGLASRLFGWSITPSMDWMATDVGLVALGVATVVELLADKVPLVDHTLDVLHTIVGPLAGALVAFSLSADLPPALGAILAIALGAPVAGGVHLIAAVTRVKSSVMSAGSFNPALSLVEDVVTVGAIAVAIFIPLLTLFIAPILIGVVLGHLFRRFARRSAPTA